MVKHFTGVELDKSESRTDWTRRPLTDKQLSYASADVEHLFAIYPKLLAEIEEIDHVDCLEFAKQETQSMIDKKFTPIIEDELYRNVKMNWRLNPKQLNSLKYLVSWRFQQAKKRDLPIGFIAKDNTLMALAQANPDSIKGMSNLEGAEALDVRHKGKAMLEVLKQANETLVSDYPKKIIRLDEYPSYKQIFKKLKAFFIELSEEHKLAVENLASKKQINQFLTWQFDLNDARKQNHKVELLSGWRYKLFGERLQIFANNNFE